MQIDTQNISSNNKTIFITGANGLLGSHLLKKLSAQTNNIKALYHNEKPEGFSNVKWIQGDILDVSFLYDALQSVQHVYHCAAKVSFDPKKKKELFKTNVEGTANVVNACLENHVEKLIHVSSVAALGKMRKAAKVDETITWTKETSKSIYGETKYFGEIEVWRGIAEGLKAIIINPTIILGAGDWNKGSSEIFKTVYKEFPYYSDGATGFVDVDDVATIMMLLMQSNIAGERFIVNAENISYKVLFDMIAETFNKKKPHKKVSPFMAEIVWRLEAFKTVFTNTSPFITKETAQTALSKVYFDNSKLLNALPQFKYTPLKTTVEKICNQLAKRYAISNK